MSSAKSVSKAGPHFSFVSYLSNSSLKRDVGSFSDSDSPLSVAPQPPAIMTGSESEDSKVVF